MPRLYESATRRIPVRRANTAGPRERVERIVVIQTKLCCHSAFITADFLSDRRLHGVRTDILSLTSPGCYTDCSSKFYTEGQLIFSDLL